MANTPRPPLPTVAAEKTCYIKECKNKAAMWIKRWESNEWIKVKVCKSCGHGHERAW